MRYTSVLTHHRRGCRQGLFGFGNPSLGQEPCTLRNGLGHVGYRFENSLYLWGGGHGNLRVGCVRMALRGPRIAPGASELVGQYVAPGLSPQGPESQVSAVDLIGPLALVFTV